MIIKKEYEKYGLNDGEVTFEENAVILATVIVSPGVILERFHTFQILSQ